MAFFPGLFLDPASMFLTPAGAETWAQTPAPVIAVASNQVFMYALLGLSGALRSLYTLFVLGEARATMLAIAAFWIPVLYALLTFPWISKFEGNTYIYTNMHMHIHTLVEPPPQLVLSI